MRLISICNRKETEKSDVHDKRQRNGISWEASVDVAIGGETSVNVAISGETSVTVAAVDKKSLSAPTVAVSAPWHVTRPQFGNSGTVEYFAGQ